MLFKLLDDYKMPNPSNAALPLFIDKRRWAISYNWSNTPSRKSAILTVFFEDLENKENYLILFQKEFGQGTEGKKILNAQEHTAYLSKIGEYDAQITEQEHTFNMMPSTAALVSDKQASDAKINALQADIDKIVKEIEKEQAGANNSKKIRSKRSSITKKKREIENEIKVTSKHLATIDNSEKAVLNVKQKITHLVAERDSIAKVTPVYEIEASWKEVCPKFNYFGEIKDLDWFLSLSTDNGVLLKELIAA